MANSKTRSKEKRVLKEEKKQYRHDTVHSGIQQMYEVSIAEVKTDASLNVDEPLGLQHVSRFLNRLVAEYYLNGHEPAGQRHSPCFVGVPFHIILNYHDQLVDQTIDPECLMMPSSEHLLTVLRENAVEMQREMDKWFAHMAKCLYNDGIKYSKEGVKRSNEEILRIVNEPDIAYYLSCLLTSYNHCRTLNGWQEFTEKLTNYFFSIGNAYTNDLCNALQTLGQAFQGAEKRRDRENDGRSSMGSTSSSTSPERKNRSEYERLVQLSKEREAREAEERLAVQRENDARIAAQREEAARAEERANQERQDAILRRLERVNIEEIEPLDAVAAAKAAETEREAREAKEKSIAESRARKREQKNKQRVKDEAETMEQEKREHARETAKRIAHGEGYSKRKGNKE